MTRDRRLSTGRAAIGLCLAAMLSACTIGSYDDAVDAFNRGNGGGTPPPADPPPDPDPPPGAGFGANFSEIQAAVFTPNCATSTCHSGGAPSAGLNLDAANSYTALVGITSSQDGTLQLVNPGNPDDSYLIRKLEGAPGISNGQMPPGTPLAQADIDVIRQWITEGAIDDRVPASAPIRVTSLSPQPGADLAAAPAQITAGFDRRPDASTVTTTTFVLTNAGGGAIAGTVSVPGGNPQSAVFDLGGASLVDGTYTIRLRGDGAAAILDEDGNRLDGERNVAFPSGDGTEGGDFVATFSVTAPPMIGATLAEIQAQVFTPSCATSTCHSGGMPDGNLDLSDGASYANLVNVATDNPPDQVRVIPGDAANSYLVRKIEGGPGILGNRMPPPPASALDPAYITAIRDWIDAGAAP